MAVAFEQVFTCCSLESCCFAVIVVLSIALQKKSQNCRGWKGSLEIVKSAPLINSFPTAGLTGRHPVKA